MLHSLNVVSMLFHRLQRWNNIETALGEGLVFAGSDVDGIEAVLPAAISREDQIMVSVIIRKCASTLTH